VQGAGYLYFTDGESSAWYSSSVPVCRLNHLTLEQWLDNHRDLATSSQNWNGLTKEQYDAKYGRLSSKDMLAVARQAAKAAGLDPKKFSRTKKDPSIALMDKLFTMPKFGTDWR